MTTIRGDRRRSVEAATGAVAGAIALLLLLAAPASAQGGPSSEPPGNAGTVAIHGTTTPDGDRRNEPQVCAFRIVGFDFPEDAAVELSIGGHGGTNAGSGSFDGAVDPSLLAGDGDWAVAGPSLPAGTYELTADNTTAPGAAKHLVFKVACDAPSTDVAPTVAPSAGTTDETSSDTFIDAAVNTDPTPGRDPVIVADDGPIAAVLGESIGRSMDATAEITHAEPARGSLPRMTAPIAAVALAGTALSTGGGALLARRRRQVANR